MPDPPFESVVPETTPSGQVILKPLAPEDWPQIDHIVTEDGAPADNVFSEKQMRLLTEPLYASWKPGRPFVAFANVGLFYGIDLPPLVPDMLLSIDVRLPENLFPKLNRSYFVWKYGKPPEVAIEVVSNRQGGEDTSKIDRYAAARVSNYVIYDPEHHLSPDDVRLFRLQGSKLVTDTSGDWTFPDLGLGVAMWQGRYEDTDATWLRWVDTRGQRIATGAEQAIAANQVAEQQTSFAEAASQRAEAEAQRANETIQRNERLRQYLLDQGIDPDALS